MAARLEYIFTAVLLVFFGRVAGTFYPPIIRSVLVNGQVNPVIVNQVNTDLVLTCQYVAAVESKDSPTVTWTKDGSVVQLATTSQSTANFVPTGSNGASTITMKSPFWVSPYVTQGQFNGNYGCTVRSSKGTAISSPAVVAGGAYIGAPLPGTEPAAVTISFNPGDLVTLPCNTTGPVTYVPSIWSMAPTFVWFGTAKNQVPGSGTFGRTELTYDYSHRYSTNEYGQLFIRNATVADFSSFSSISCHITSKFSLEVSMGNYLITPTMTTGSMTSAVKLLYKSPDLTVAEGTSFYLSCIFDDKGGAIQAITWNKPFTLSFDNGARIQIADATTDMSTSWICAYTKADGISASGTINVNVLSYPDISGLQDTFVTSGSNAKFTCIARGPTPVTISWYKNDIPVGTQLKYTIVSTSSFTSTLTVSNVDKTDIGVISCKTANTLATRIQGVRLIVTDPATVTLSAILDSPVAGSPGDYPVNSNTTVIRFLCNFTLDPDISGETVVWQMQGYTGDITADTVAPDFGISKSSVITQGKQSAFAIQFTPDSSQRIWGAVNCTVVYQILGQTFRVPSGNSGRIYAPVAPSPIVIVTAAQFPYWIIGVIVAALFLILLVFLIIFCVQRNKGEQYYVDEKERKAGHDPKEELPPWQEFNRPDQDPVKGSRASLEMEGERPMGSDTGSMDEYGVDTDTGKFNEDGSFIGQYGPKGQRPGATGHV